MAVSSCAPLSAQALPLTAGTATATVRTPEPAVQIAGTPHTLPDSQPEENQGYPPVPSPTPASTAFAILSIPTRASPVPLPTWPARPSGPVSALLYLTQDRLLLWDPRTGVLPVADGVSAFTASANGQVAAYQRPRLATANGVQRFDLELYNLQTTQAITLLQESPPLLQVALSPKGDWVAYRLDVEGGPIYALPVSQAAQVRPPIRLGACTPQHIGDCSRLDWSQDAEAVVWSDSHGVWLARPAAPQASELAAQLIHPAEVSVVDPKGKTARMSVHLSQPDWHRDGRFVLLHVQPPGSTVSWYALLDTIKKQLAEVPDSYSTTPGDSSVRWLPDGSLLVTHSSEPLRRIPPYVRILRVTPTSPRMLEINKTFDLYSDAIPFSDSTRKVIPTHSLDWPGYALSGRMPLGINLIGTDTAPVLFQLELQFGRLEKLAELPADVVQIYWSPDGRHGLLINSEGKNVRLIGFPVQDKVAFYDLLPVLGPEPHSFLWLAPTLRP